MVNPYRRPYIKIIGSTPALSTYHVDIEMMYPEEMKEHKPYLVQTEFEIGLTKEHADQAVALLNLV